MVSQIENLVDVSPDLAGTGQYFAGPYN